MIYKGVIHEAWAVVSVESTLTPYRRQAYALNCQELFPEKTDERLHDTTTIIFIHSSFPIFDEDIHPPTPTGAWLFLYTTCNT